MMRARRSCAPRRWAILSGEPVDEEVASRRLGYALARHHVAMRVSSGASEVPGLERAVERGRGGARSGRAARRALRRRAVRRLVGLVRSPGDRRARALRAAAGVCVAFGRPAEGIAGFRSSHGQALQAARIGSLAGTRDPR